MKIHFLTILIFNIFIGRMERGDVSQFVSRADIFVVCETEKGEYRKLDEQRKKRRERRDIFSIVSYSWLVWPLSRLSRFESRYIGVFNICNSARKKMWYALTFHGYHNSSRNKNYDQGINDSSQFRIKLFLHYYIKLWHQE